MKRSDKAKTGPKFNPLDCSCEHIHASSTTCRSKEVSRGAVKESDRIFPAERQAKGEQR